MKLDSRLKSAAAVILTLVLATQLEWPAMAQSSDRTAVETPEKIAPVRIPNVSAAAAAPQTPAQAAAARLALAAPQAQAPKKRGVLKWILIGAGAGVGVAVLAKRGEPVPVITVGAPVVERPQ